MRLSPLPRAFYARPVLTVARQCIGKLLVHRTPEAELVGRIVEVEAYRGPEDRAAHSFGGRRTARTEVMYGPPGFAYVFFVYGMHYQFNIVTTREGDPHAVLVRAVEPVQGADWMAKRRKLPADSRELTSGPGKLCQAFGINRSDYGADLCGSRLFLADGPPCKAVRSARIGVQYAQDWAKKTWRFSDPKSRYVSRARP
ncbi:MAG TPA: DNA-3-methyladenine glycosylase [Polyangiaceae bacterium]|nr:DNA-3-methyladenine glycosylase [Polyangiaceae bacterium]